MGCGSSHPGPAHEQPNHHDQANGHVKMAATPPPQNQPQAQRPEAPRQKTPESKRSRSSKSSTSSDSSHSKKSSLRPETTPGQDANVESAGYGEKEKIENAAIEQNTEPDKYNTNDKPDGPPIEEQNNEETEKPNFSEEILKEFVDLESEIRELEKTDPENMYRTKHSTLTEMYKAIKLQQEKLDQLKQQTIKEYQDVVQIANPSVRAMFANQMQLDAQVAKEQQEYLDALNRQEVAQDELETTKEQYKRLYEEVDQALKATQALYSKRLKQEEILGKIFNDCYGSDREWKLELELDLTAERKERIKTANYKWTNAQTFLKTAADQVSWAARRWAQIGTINGANTMVKYQMVAETRNHLIAASQNISTGTSFMAPIKAPYCKEEDLKTLNAAISTIFNDINVPVLCQRAYNLYCDIYNKTTRLVEWTGMVITHTIKKDLADINIQYHEQYFELKKERYTLIQAKVKEALGVDIELDIKKEEPPEDKEDTGPQEGAVATPTAVVTEEGEEKAPEAQETGELPASPPAGMEAPTEVPAEGGETVAPEGGEGGETASEAAPPPNAAAAAAAAAVPLTELAPPPSHDDLFGDIEQLKKKHEEELAEFEKTQNMNRARVEQGLQEKLRARRSRKRKVKVQEAEAQLLTDAPPADAL